MSSHTHPPPAFQTKAWEPRISYIYIQLAEYTSIYIYFTMYIEYMLNTQRNLLESYAFFLYMACNVTHIMLLTNYTIHG